jgi:hypothetical protein
MIGIFLKEKRKLRCDSATRKEKCQRKVDQVHRYANLNLNTEGVAKFFSTPMAGEINRQWLFLVENRTWYKKLDFCASL